MGIVGEPMMLWPPHKPWEGSMSFELTRNTDSSSDGCGRDVRGRGIIQSAAVLISGLLLMT